MHKDSLQQRQDDMRQRWGHPPGPGRPRLAIDPERVFELALLGYTNAEIARQIPCDRKTLTRFAAVLERARARHVAPLKLREFHAAIAEGNPEALQRCFKGITRDELRSRQLDMAAAQQRARVQVREEVPAPAAAQRNNPQHHQPPATPVSVGSIKVDAAGRGIRSTDSSKTRSPSNGAKPEQTAKPKAAKPQQPVKPGGWIFMELI